MTVESVYSAGGSDETDAVEIGHQLPEDVCNEPSITIDMPFYLAVGTKHTSFFYYRNTVRKVVGASGPE